MEEEPPLTQTWTPIYNYCIVCSKELKQKPSKICSSNCWLKVEKLKEAVDSRINVEKSGGKLTAEVMNNQFETLQFELSK